MKQFYLLFLVVLFAMNRSFSQSSYNYDDDGRVTNFYFKTDFYYTCRVDYDFMRQYNCVNVITSVIIDIKSDGKGRYISFINGKKNVFIIDESWIDDVGMHYSIKNSNGAQFYATLASFNGYWDSFSFKYPYDNTGFILLYTLK